MINEEILTTLQNQGIKKGDVLLVSSGVSKFIKNFCEQYEIDYSRKNTNIILGYFINTLQNLIGKQGTLLFPTYNWEWCRGKRFIYEKTLGATGYLGNYCLTRDDFQRTQHPIYSFAVWGKYKDYLISLDNIDSWGVDSPFAFLYKYNAKNLFINCDAFYTFKHFVEQCVGVKYRYQKFFKSIYEINGMESTREYAMYVRDLSLNIESDGPATIRLLFQKKACKYFDLFFTKCGIIDMRFSYEIIKDDIINNYSRNLIKQKDLVEK